MVKIIKFVVSVRDKHHKLCDRMSQINFSLLSKHHSSGISLDQFTIVGSTRKTYGFQNNCDVYFKNSDTVVHIIYTMAILIALYML